MLSIYKASAGSGKTYTLTREYLRLLLMDCQPARDIRHSHSRILAVTFTKKSTAEMKERILTELYVLAHTPNESKYIRDFCNDPKLGMSQEQIQQRAKQLLIEILQDYSHFSVSTIDGFFQYVIRSFAKELHLSATYDIAMDGEEIVQQAVDDVFLRIKQTRKEDEDLLSWLVEYAHNNIEENKKWNPNQSIKKFSTELLKERLMCRIEDLQHAFSNKQLMRGYQSTLQSIIHQTEAEVTKLREQCLDILYVEEGWSSKFVKAIERSSVRWLEGDVSAEFVKVLEGEGTAYTKTKTPKSQQEHLAAIYEQQLYPLCLALQNYCEGEAARAYMTAKLILPNLYQMGILQDVAQQIQETNRNVGRLPISETNQLVHKIIDGQDAPFIYERIGQYFRHYMIDEFQDTSALQWSNFYPLVYDAESAHRDNLIVGDAKQSIYRFRNSNWHLLNQLQHQFYEVDMPKMESNYRTAKLVIDENEKLLQRYSQWVADELEKKYHQPHLTEDIRTIYSFDQMHQKAQKDYEGYFRMQFFEDKHYVEAIKEQLYTQLQELQNEGIDLQRVTLLVRENKDAAMFANFLIEKGFKVQSKEGLRVEAHPMVQLLIHLLRWSADDEQSIDEAFIKQILGDITDEQKACILHAQQLPLYEQVQMLIDELQLHTQNSTTPYLIAFQDFVYRFMQSHVADTKSFLEYWERKKSGVTISAPTAPNTIRIMTIHNSKGLEFDIVIIPQFDWDIEKIRPNNILWCTPTKEPFDTLPLVAVNQTPKLLRSYLADDYIQEELAQYTDNLNLTYVAITRPRYRLYLYGPMYTTVKNVAKINNIGHLVSYLYRDELDESLTYCVSTTASNTPPALPDSDDEVVASISGVYMSEPIGDRLQLRSRAEDDFAQDTELDVVDVGILMHLWLSKINTWSDAEKSLLRLMREGHVTEKQTHIMRQQMMQLQQVIQRENHTDWFEGKYKILSEQDIITPTGNIYRPDRVMINNQHAIVIDYKFGKEQPVSHCEQVRNYMLLLQQMGYTTEGYIIYVALQTIHTIQ